MSLAKVNWFDNAVIVLTRVALQILVLPTLSMI